MTRVGKFGFKGLVENYSCSTNPLIEYFIHKDLRVRVQILSMLSENQIVKRTADYVKERLSGEGTGHDWWHVYRVWKASLYIAKRERKCDLFTVQIAALLHDIADWKFNKDPLLGSKIAKQLLRRYKVNKDTITNVCYIVDNISFKGGTSRTKMRTKEGMIVQDADRLDALGAIGIARTFAYGGFKGRDIYNPGIKPLKYRNFKEFKRLHSKSTTINHFYEKLLLLRDLMNTKTGRRIAKEREDFMKEYLDRFFKDWNVKIQDK